MALNVGIHDRPARRRIRRCRRRRVDNPSFGVSAVDQIFRCRDTGSIEHLLSRRFRRVCAGVRVLSRPGIVRRQQRIMMRGSAPLKALSFATLFTPQRFEDTIKYCLKFRRPV